MQGTAQRETALQSRAFQGYNSTRNTVIRTLPGQPNAITLAAYAHPPAPRPSTLSARGAFRSAPDAPVRCGQSWGRCGRVLGPMWPSPGAHCKPCKRCLRTGCGRRSAATSAAQRGACACVRVVGGRGLMLGIGTGTGISIGISIATNPRRGVIDLHVNHVERAALRVLRRPCAALALDLPAQRAAARDVVQAVHHTALRMLRRPCRRQSRTA